MTTFAARFARALGYNTLAVFMLFSGLYLAHATADIVRPDHSVFGPQAPVAKGSPVDIMRHHKCWTGEAPAGIDYPGHVIAADRGGDYALRGKHVVDLTLDTLFGSGKDHGYTVYAYCK